MQELEKLLLEKYDVPVPRYTSYPPVPNWNPSEFTIPDWLEQIKVAFLKSNATKGVSLYIHLPFCERLCTYCGCNKRITKNHDLELPYIDALLKEWAMYRDLFDEMPIVSELHLGGGTPTFFAPKHLHKLIKGIFLNAKAGPNLQMSAEVHPNVTTFEHLETLRSLGFNRLSVGIQDFDPYIQAIINRYQTFERTKTVFEEARRLGFESINADLVYGLPCQTPRSITLTFEAIKDLRPDRVAFYSYAHVPWVSKGQRKFDENDVPTNVEKRMLYEMGRNFLFEQGYQLLGMDHFALPHDSLYKSAIEGKIHRNFMGYTIQNTELLLGLGCSSISDSGCGYVQNEKVVENYQKLITEGRWPISKGHLLTKDQKKVKKHILQLMCTFETTWHEDTESSLQWNDLVVRLSTFIGDGIVEISGETIRITEAGKPFVRNVCAAFDPEYQNNSKEKNIFSKAI